ncbi:hypothetical protein [Kitasatospora sp. NPDC002040]|uniref:hypothetical protein n=1 Tax=Kitasatospora sp. NPDC002040 TaxID=3154661 RepID=UPI00332B41CD
MPAIPSPSRLNEALAQALGPYLPYDTDLVFDLPDPAALTRPTVSMALAETTLTEDPRGRQAQRSVYYGALDYVITYWPPASEFNSEAAPPQSASVLMAVMGGLLRARPLQGIADSNTTFRPNDGSVSQRVPLLLREAGLDPDASHLLLLARITAPIHQLGLAEQQDAPDERLRAMGLSLNAADRQRATEYLQEHPDATGGQLIGFLTAGS